MTLNSRTRERRRLRLRLPGASGIRGKLDERRLRGGSVAAADGIEQRLEIDADRGRGRSGRRRRAIRRTTRCDVGLDRVERGLRARHVTRLHCTDEATEIAPKRVRLAVRTNAVVVVGGVPKAGHGTRDDTHVDMRGCTSAVDLHPVPRRRHTCCFSKCRDAVRQTLPSSLTGDGIRRALALHPAVDTSRRFPAGMR